MFGRIHYLLWAAVAFLGGATVWADAGYLPQAGPIALRFRVPAPPVAEPVNAPVPPPAAISLPPPPMPSKPPESSNTPPAKLAETNGPALEYNARESAPAPTPLARADSIIVPQMLLKYFTTSANLATNAAAAGLARPFGFTPPAVTTPPAPTPMNKPAPSTPP